MSKELKEALDTIAALPSESQITSGKAESIGSDIHFMSMMANYGTGFDRCEEARIIAHIEAVREKDREEASLQAQDALGIVVRNLEAESEKSQAHITHMTHRMNTALAANRKLEAERDHFKAIAERQAAGLSVMKINDLARQHGCAANSGSEGYGHDYFNFTVKELHTFVQALLSPAQQEPKE